MSSHVTCNFIQYYSWPSHFWYFTLLQVVKKRRETISLNFLLLLLYSFWNLLCTSHCGSRIYIFFTTTSLQVFYNYAHDRTSETKIRVNKSNYPKGYMLIMEESRFEIRYFDCNIYKFFKKGRRVSIIDKETEVERRVLPRLRQLRLESMSISVNNNNKIPLHSPLHHNCHHLMLWV